MAWTVDVTGRDELITRLRHVVKSGPDVSGAANRAAANVVKRKARQIVAVDTGALRSSIRVQALGGKYRGYATLMGSPKVINPKSGVPTTRYALYIELRDSTLEKAADSTRAAQRKAALRAIDAVLAGRLPRYR